MESKIVGGGLFIILIGSGVNAAPFGYNLKGQFDPDSLKNIILANQQVQLVRQLPDPSAWYSVWTSFTPFPNNFISWNSSGLGVYAASAPPAEGFTVFVGSSTYVQEDLVYPFESASYFGRPFSPKFPVHEEVVILNNSSNIWTFGLTADVSVNSAASLMVPISAGTLLQYEHEFFPNNNDIFIFLAQPNRPGTLTKNLIEIAASRITALKFNSQQTTITVSWDPQNGRFITT